MPTSYNSANISGSNIAVNSPQITLPYVWDSTLNGGAGAWRPGQGGSAGVSGHCIQQKSSTTDSNLTSSALLLNTTEGVHYKHGYLIKINSAGKPGFAARFKVQGSADNSAWIDLEVNDLTGAAEVQTGVAYYDEWNFNYARVKMEASPGTAGVTGIYTINERHDL